MALTSLLLTAVLLVYWWRSNHGHMDHFTLGKGTETESQFTASSGRIVMEVTDRKNVLVKSRMQFYPFPEVIGYFLIIPGLWVAIKVRNLLPRPPGGGLSARPRGSGRIRDL